VTKKIVGVFVFVRRFIMEGNASTPADREQT
jgi:hypothetical protein